MYAIIQDGTHQFKVEEGQEVQIDYRDLPSGQQITFDRVLAVRSEDGFKLGQPVVEGASRHGGNSRRHPGSQAHRPEVSTPQDVAPQDRPPPARYEGQDPEDRSGGLRLR